MGDARQQQQQHGKTVHEARLPDPKPRRGSNQVREISPRSKNQNRESAPSGRAQRAQARKRAAKTYGDDEEAVRLGKTVLGIFDADGSGCLERHEMEIATFVLQDTPLEGTGVVSELIADGPMDYDGDGNVDAQEWTRFMESIYQLLGRKQFMNVLQIWITQARERYPSKDSGAEALLAIEVEAAQNHGDSQKAPVDQACVPETEQPHAESIHAAAIKIQAIRRGRRGRAEAALKKASFKSKPESTHVLTTVGDAWDLLTSVEGTRGRYLDLTEFLELFRDAKKTGLDTLLAVTAPVYDEGSTLGGSVARDVTPEQVCQLCEWVIEGREMTEGEVVFELDLVQSKHGQRGQDAPLTLDARLRGMKLNHRHFVTLLPMLARLMALDKQYLVSHFAWLKTNMFEAPAPLLALTLQQCANSNKSRLSKEDAYRGKPDLSILNNAFSLNDHVKMGMNGHLMAEGGSKGIGVNEYKQLYFALSRHMKERLAARFEKRKELHPYSMISVTTPEAGGDEGQRFGFAGAEAFEVLFSELHSLCPSKRFASPLSMLVHMIRQGTENPLVND